MTVTEWGGSNVRNETVGSSRERFTDFLRRLDEGETEKGVETEALRDSITETTPLVYWSMEFYDKEENDIKGGGGLGILAADTRRVAEDLGIPLVVVTPFYTQESHQELSHFFQVERQDIAVPEKLYRHLGRVSVRTTVHSEVPIDVYHRELGSTRIVAVTEPDFGELYPGSNSGDHRLYQEVALGFAGYQAIKSEGLNPPYMQLNEAPTVFAALALLDDLCQSGQPFDTALEQVRKKMLYTNHTLVQAVEGEFEQGQFEHMVLPNVANESVREWVEGLFGDSGRLKLSSLAIELAETKSGVSELHARVSNFHDRAGAQVEFQAVTNGISRKWILPEALSYYEELGALDEFDLPTADFRERLQGLSMERVRAIRDEGRRVMNEILAERKDQYGNPVHIDNSALAYDFKRRFASYKRPELMFSDPDRLAGILKNQDAHFLLTGKPHPMDEHMKHELTRLLQAVDEHPTLRERVHYIQDYDEAVGRALSVGADCAINVPVVGEEACGTSWMKDLANFKLLISTPDGGVADIDPIACLEVSGDEADSLYQQLEVGAAIIRDDTVYREQLVRQLQEYLPIISGSRMMGEYLRLFRGLGDTATRA